MAAEGRHTVFGFGCGLDWRPTVFVDGFSSTRVCNACGLVPSTTALLSCRHVLCQPCYDRCIAKDSRCCLDGESIKCDDVGWSTFSVESLLRRKIHCWNTPVGCTASGRASDILDHFGKECEYHAVLCVRCEQSIAHRDVVDHMASASCTQGTFAEHSACGGTASEVKQIVNALGQLEIKFSLLQASFQENLERIVDGRLNFAETTNPNLGVLESVQCLDNTVRENTLLNRQAVGELTASHATLHKNLAAINNSLQELASNLRTLENHILRESESRVLTACANVKRDVDAPTSDSKAEMKKIAEKLELLEGMIEEIKAKPASQEFVARFYEEVSAKLAVLEAVSYLPFNNRLDISEPLEWSIESWSAVKKRVKNGEIFAQSPKYLYGYYILPGVVFITKGNVQSLGLAFQICKGVYDQVLTWPIEKTLRLSFLHPTEPRNVRSVAVNTARERFEDYNMPREERNRPRWSLLTVNVRDLEESGYIKDDKIIVKFEVLL